MADKIKKTLVTYALPYANGSLHLGHMVGFIQTDIWVRAYKMQPNVECLFLCGCDGHGTPIMIQAEKLQITPEEMIAAVQKEQNLDIGDFLVEIDNYHTTHSAENQELVTTVFTAHANKGNISKHTIKQAFDPLKNMFLPDRYIKGECPRCQAKDQYGDNCETCGATYSPLELKNPYSTLSGVAPIEKDSLHYFFKLQNYSTFLQTWTRQGSLQTQVTNKLDEWFTMGLKEWDISRDAPYFGFKIPGEDSKYFYVWLDAPIGYMASFVNLKENLKNLNFDEYWGKNSEIPLYHFIGKDIMYFHTLFWPALLAGADFRLPTAIFCHGFLTIDGQKMSKSRGTFIKARTYLEHLSPEYLRYYLATKLNDRIEDLDLNFDDFTQRVNSDLIGKFVNIASRSASFIHKYFNGELSAQLPESTLLQEVAAKASTIQEKYLSREFNQAMRQIFILADLVNQYVDTKKPWTLIKDNPESLEVQQICTLALNLFRLLMLYLKPVLPSMAKKAEAFLNIPPLQWNDATTTLVAHTIAPFQPLATRIDKECIKALQEASRHATV
jgi:methionyl-tRNA synthetase